MDYMNQCSASSCTLFDSCSTSMLFVWWVSNVSSVSCSTILLYVIGRHVYPVYLGRRQNGQRGWWSLGADLSGKGWQSMYSYCKSVSLNRSDLSEVPQRGPFNFKTSIANAAHYWRSIVIFWTWHIGIESVSTIRDLPLDFHTDWHVTNSASLLADSSNNCT